MDKEIIHAIRDPQDPDHGRPAIARAGQPRPDRTERASRPTPSSPRPATHPGWNHSPGTSASRPARPPAPPRRPSRRPRPALHRLPPQARADQPHGPRSTTSRQGNQQRNPDDTPPPARAATPVTGSRPEAPVALPALDIAAASGHIPERLIWAQTTSTVERNDHRPDSAICRVAATFCDQFSSGSTARTAHGCPRRSCLKIGSQNRTPPLPKSDNPDLRKPA